MKTKHTLRRAQVIGSAYRVLANWRGQELEYLVSVPADPALTITELIAAGLTKSTYQVALQRASLADRWQIVSIIPEPDPDIFPFKVNYYYPPNTKQGYGYELRAVDKKEARREFKAKFPGAKIWRIEDWYEF